MLFTLKHVEVYLQLFVATAPEHIRQNVQVGDEARGQGLVVPLARESSQAEGGAAKRIESNKTRSSSSR